MRADRFVLHSKRLGNRCHYCGIQVNSGMASLDHYIPYSKGGRGFRNFRMACVPCNTLKGSFDPKSFYSRIEKVLVRTPRFAVQEFITRDFAYAAF